IHPRAYRTVRDPREMGLDGHVLAPPHFLDAPGWRGAGRNGALPVGPVPVSRPGQAVAARPAVRRHRNETLSPVVAGPSDPDGYPDRSAGGRVRGAALPRAGAAV